MLLIIEAIEVGDPDAAEVAYRDHVASAHKIALKRLAGQVTA